MTGMQTSLLLERAGQREGLLVTAGHRVWVNPYGDTSPGELEMANPDVLTGNDDENSQKSSLGFGRNGHAAKTAAYTGR